MVALGAGGGVYIFYIYYGQPGGWSAGPLRRSLISDDAFFSRFSFVVYPNAADADFADVTLNALGDIDGDGFDDIGLASLKGDKWVFEIVYGQAGGWGESLTTSPADQVTTIVLGDATRESVPVSRPSIKLDTLDWNGDGSTDLLFSASQDTLGIHLDLDGLKGETIAAGVLQADADVTLINSGDPDGLGIIAAASVGDVNGDGAGDLFVSSLHERLRPASSEPGVFKSYTAQAHRILFGGTGSSAVVDLDTLGVGDFTEIFEQGYAIDRLYSGLPVNAVGDFNGDGFDDIVVGYANAPLTVMFGAADPGAGMHLDAVDGSNGFVIEGLPWTYYATDGFEITGSDVNGDGFSDIVVGSFAGDETSVGQNGLGWVLFGKASGLSASVDLWSLQASDGFRLVTPYPGVPADWASREAINVHQPFEGIEQFALADIDGDGLTDLVKSAVSDGVTSVHTLYGKTASIVDGGGVGDIADELTVSGGGAVYTFGGDDLVTIRPGIDPIEILTGEGDDRVTIDAGHLPLAGDHAGEIRVFGGAGDDVLSIAMPPGANGVGLPAAGTYLFGGAGADTYEVSAKGFAAGRLVIDDLSVSGSGNSLVLGAGYSSSDITLGYGSLKLGFADDGLEIHLQHFDKGDVLAGPRDIDQIRFEDGSELSFGQLVTRGFDVDGTAADDELEGTSLVDRLSGFDGDDRLDGGVGNDRLSGGLGDDEFHFEAGHGRDVVVDAGGNDSIVFGAGIVGDALVFARQQLDLQIATDDQDEILIANWFSGQSGRIETFAFADGTSVNADLLVTSRLQSRTRVIGTGASEVLYGTAGGDDVEGRGGNDTLYGYAGDDVFLVAGGGGYDRVFGGDGHDRIVAGAGGVAIGLLGDFGEANSVEEIAGGSGGNVIRGSWHSAKMDFSGIRLSNIAEINGGSGHDTIIGTDFDDVIVGATGNDILRGGAGDDVFRVTADAGYDRVIGGDGEDRIVAGDGDDVIGVLDGIDAGNGIEEIDGGAGYNRIRGSWKDNSLDFSSVRLVGISGIEGGSGNDRITGTSSSDVISGGSGNDTLIGSGGADVLSGGSGNDVLRGGAGADVYRFGIGDGADQVADGLHEGMDRLEFGAGIAKENVLFMRQQDDLLVRIDGGNDEVGIKGWYADSHRRVEQIVCDDGAVITADQVDRLVSDMAAFNQALSGQFDVTESNGPLEMPLAASYWETPMQSSA